MIMERPALAKGLNGAAFRNFYYLKEELVRFCRENKLPASGSKLELTDRIAHYLDTGEVIPAAAAGAKRPVKTDAVSEEALIEAGFVCSEAHRAFFKAKIGPKFTFNIEFQKWLQSNAGKTYGEAITAYRNIAAEKKHKKTTIASQFEYNTYIRDFFADNQGKTLKDAIKCWKYKKSLAGHNQYEPSDLIALYV